ncbi:MAG TPA: OmpA family protein [Candidatus Solibacter sp.]|jgi:peptidoglycan-associated lipoprotein
MNRGYPILILMLCASCGCGGRRGRVDPTWTPSHPAGNPTATGDKQPEPKALDRPAPSTDPVTPAAPPSGILTDALPEVNRRLQDIFFTYDHSEITPDGLTALRRDAELLASVLAEFPQAKLIVEGHCDERGSAEYNLGLGDHRAARVAAALREFGVLPGRIETISYGKEAPQCTEPAESCWRRNRRAHLAVR